MYNFITIDFETASRYEYSPCSVSLYEFNEEKYSKLLSTLINPGDVFFDPHLTNLHGITKDMVKSAPSINIILQKICDLIGNKFIFAHNASFDISKLVQGCNLYNIDIPYFEYADSLMVAKRTWPNLINYKLDTVCDYLNIELNHHNADSDSVACGQIIRAAMNEHNILDINDLLENIHYVKGSYINNKLISAYSKSLHSNNHPKVSDYTKIKDINIDTSINTPISGKYFVFTGSLTIKRQYAMELVASHGGIPEGGITKRTNYLVVGKDDYGNFKLGNKSNKMIKAEQLISKGQDLEMITEDDFLDMIS